MSLRALRALAGRSGESQRFGALVAQALECEVHAVDLTQPTLGRGAFPPLLQFVETGRASGAQLRELTVLIDAGHLRPVVDRVFPFDATLDAVAYVDQGRTKGKVVVSLD